MILFALLDLLISLIINILPYQGFFGPILGTILILIPLLIIQVCLILVSWHNEKVKRYAFIISISITLYFI